MKDKLNLFRTASYILLAVFVLLAIFWLAYFNRYHVLYYQEQMQLFRFSGFYFHSYWIKPGGIAGYAGAFLTQFYFFPWLGAVIIALLLAGIYLLIDSICRRNGKIEYLFAALFIPVLLLMMVLTYPYFRLSYLMGLMVGLVVFRIYIAFKTPVRYIVGGFLLLAVYLVAAGNALLFFLMVLIFEMYSSKGLYRYIYLLALAVLTALIPFLAYRFVYTVTLHEAFFALTPAGLLRPDIVTISAWLSIPVIYVCWRALSDKMNKWKLAVWKMIAFCIIVVGMCIGSIALTNDRKAEVITGMAFGVQNNNFERAVKLGESYPFSNSLISYFTNIALAESGQLPYRMFYYDQPGPAGLFLKWQESYTTVLYIGEAYYRLGLMQEAEHSAFEAMVANPVEHNSQTLRRLVTTSIIVRDTALFNKYIRLFDQTIFYRGWAKRQRQYMVSALADSAYVIPETPQAAWCNDFFTNYGKPELILNKILEKNPDHQLAFEYLMAWYMLNKDMNGMKNCMDTYYHRFQYKNIPVHFEEALLVYQVLNPATNILLQYPVSEQTQQRFNIYVQAYQQVRNNPQLVQQLYRQFGKTYWFYFHFRRPESLQKTEDENKY